MLSKCDDVISSSEQCTHACLCYLSHHVQDVLFMSRDHCPCHCSSFHAAVLCDLAIDCLSSHRIHDRKVLAIGGGIMERERVRDRSFKLK